MNLVAGETMQFVWLKGVPKSLFLDQWQILQLLAPALISTDHFILQELNKAFSICRVTAFLTGKAEEFQFRLPSAQLPPSLLSILGQHSQGFLVGARFPCLKQVQYACSCGLGLIEIDKLSRCFLLRDLQVDDINDVLIKCNVG